MIATKTFPTADVLLRRQDLRWDVIHVVKGDVESHHFTALNKHVTPYDGNHWHDCRPERNQFLDELADLIIDRFTALKTVIDGAK